MAFNEFLSYFVVGMEMLALFAIFVALYFIYPSEIYYWNKFCDNCSNSTAQYRYVIRFIFGKFKTNFQMSATTVFLEIWDANKVMVFLKMPPKLLLSQIENYRESGLNCVRFLLYRREPLLNICNVMVNHDGTGTINVTTVEIQDINSTEANIAYIGDPISCLPKDKANIKQMYPSATKEPRPIEVELKPQLTLRANEYTVFLFVALNLMVLLPVYIIPCPSNGLCSDYSDAYLASVFAGLTSGTLSGWFFMIVIFIYRYAIKSSIVKGVHYFSFIGCAYISFALILGLVFGFITALMAGNNRKFPTYQSDGGPYHEVFWAIAVAVAFVVFLCLWLAIFAVIAYWIGFFHEPPQIQKVPEEGKGTEMETTTRTPYETEETSSDYYNTILKGNTKVKSISQYTGLKGTQQSGPPTASSGPPKSTKSSKASEKKSKPTDQRTASNESIGSNYYKQLMQTHGKVKSVSQYKGPGK